MLIYIITIILHHNIQFMMILKKRSFHYSFLPLRLLSSPMDRFMSFHFINLCDSLKRMKSAKKVSVAQLCPTLCDPMDCSPPDSSVCEILQTKILEWVAIPFTRGSSQPRDRTQISCIADGLPSVSSSLVNFISIYFINFCDQSQESIFAQR